MSQNEPTRRVSRPPGLLSDARRPLQRSVVEAAPARIEGRREDPKGKSKVVDGLEEYLNKDTRRPLPRKKRLAASPVFSGPAVAEGAREKKSRLMQAGSSSANKAADISERNPRTKITEASILKGTLKRARGTRGKLLFDRQKEFGRAWLKLGCSTKLDASLLADKIAMMRKYGTDPQSSAMMTANILREKGDAAYQAKCMGRLSRVNTFLARELKDISQHPHLSKLDADKQLDIGLAEAIKKANRNDKKRKRTSDLVQSSSSAPLANKVPAQIRIKRAGSLLEEHLRSKRLELSEMSMKDLGNEIRELNIPDGVNRGHFIRSIHRYVQHTRGESEQSMETMRQRHARELAKVRTQAARRAKKERAREQARL